MSEQAYGYDDIEKYSFVKLRGKEGYVLDKGDHLRPQTNAEHLHISLMEPDDRGKEDKFLHSSVVDRYLRKKRTLWVDFHNKLQKSVAD